MVATLTRGAGAAEGATGLGAPLRARLAASMARHRVPGVAVGLWHAGEAYVDGVGITNVAHPAPVDGDTLFQVGSLTKLVTALAVLRLVEQGRLALDAPLRTSLPDLRLADAATAACVTPRHLLAHTGGWVGDYFPDTGRGDDALARAVAGMATLAQLTPLGQLWAYNNAGYYLAGRLIEVATGRPYEAAARDLVLAPLGLERSVFFPEDALLHRVAVGHNVGVDGRATVATPWAVPRCAHAAAGLISSARDQLHHARIHLGDGPVEGGARLLTPALRALMQEPTLPAWPGERVGLPWYVRELGGVRVLRHSGATNGQLAQCVVVPARGFALVLLANATSGAALRREVTVWALRHYLGLREEEPRPLARQPRDLAAYAGHYAAPLARVEIAVRAGGLVLEERPTDAFPADAPPPAPPPERVAFCAPDTLLLLAGPRQGTRAEVLRDAHGPIRWLRLEGRLHRRVG